MAKNIKISNHDLAALGISDITLLKELGKIAKGMVKKQGADKKKVLALVKEVWDAPEDAPAENPFSGLADEIIDYKKTISPVMNEVAWKLHSGLDFSVYGSDFIDQPTMHQMQMAMKLPITKAGALMPDAHVGYGLPIGGVLATDANVVIPYAVGVDIACRMCLSVYDLPATLLDTDTARFKKMLQEHTVFGSGGETKVKYDDTLFDRDEWNATRMLKGLKDKAWRQLGSSGTGNHFAEWGVITIEKPDPSMNIPAGEYLALLSHSGSRGFGANIANHYSRIAMQKTRLVNEVKHLAWLDMNCEEGMEYWLAMNLAGDYASVNHHEIHNKISRALRHQPIARVENHHNFAWKETLADGTPVIVHRKGATPAGE
ncbi:MAG TPA: RtcB family protein, partial [Bacteroidia bacterium]|nr:RtcB family protein [Bacteroidia bacterium]